MLANVRFTTGGMFCGLGRRTPHPLALALQSRPRPRERRFCTRPSSPESRGTSAHGDDWYPAVAPRNTGRAPSLHPAALSFPTLICICPLPDTGGPGSTASTLSEGQLTCHHCRGCGQAKGGAGSRTAAPGGAVGGGRRHAAQGQSPRPGTRGTQSRVRLCVEGRLLRRCERWRHR